MKETELTKSIAKIKGDVKKLEAKLTNHVGDVGESIHGLPSNGQAGFMPAEFYKKNQHLFENRLHVTNVDVLSLAPDVYYGNYLINIPNGAEFDALALIDVTAYGDGRKLITYRQAYLNITWSRTMHVPSENPNGKDWIKQTSSNVLWEGAVSAVNSTITLSDPKSNYDFLEIIIEGAGHNVTSQTFTTSRGMYVVGVTNIPDKVDINIAHTEVGLDFGKSQTVVKIAENKTIYVSAQYSGTVDGVLGTITAIVGINF